MISSAVHTGGYFAIYDNFASLIDLAQSADGPDADRRDNLPRSITVLDCADGDTLELVLHEGTVKTIPLKANYGAIAKMFPLCIGAIGTGTSAGVVVMVIW